MRPGLAPFVPSALKTREATSRQCRLRLPCQFGKIILHLLFGWSLDKDQKSLDQSKQIYALAEFKLWNLFKLVDLASVYL